VRSERSGEILAARLEFGATIARVRSSARFLVLAASTVLLASCAGLDTAAAVVNGRKIDEDEFRRQLDYLATDPRFAAQIPAGQQATEKKNLARQLLTFLIHQEFIEDFAEDRGISAAEEEVQARLDELVAGEGTGFEARLAKAGVTLDDARSFIRKQLLREKVAEAVVAEEVPEETLTQAYEARAAEFSQVHVAHILVSDQGQAQDILARATPRNFGRLARQLSEDPGSATQGGDLGIRGASDFVEPFRQATLDIPVGEIGGPVETQFGFHVIYVVERTMQPFSEVREQLLREVGQESFTQWLLEQIRTADILVNPRYGALNERTGDVVERRSTTQEPDQVQLTP
jgi:foldase protein PrsA